MGRIRGKKVTRREIQSMGMYVEKAIPLKGWAVMLSFTNLVYIRKRVAPKKNSPPVETAGLRDNGSD